MMKKLLLPVFSLLVLAALVSCSRQGSAVAVQEAEAGKAVSVAVDTAEPSEPDLAAESALADALADETVSVDDAALPDETEGEARSTVLRYDWDGPDPEGVQTVQVCGVDIKWNGYRAMEPVSDLDILSMEAGDFGPFFQTPYEVERDVYTIMEGTISETTVTHIHSANPGPAVYVVGAVHGDERAAWYAAILLRDITIKSGDLYVLAPANANGARNISRYVSGNLDLNRSFPGDPSGDDAEQLAAAIFDDIADKRPAIVLDLHEAIIYSSTRDFLGSTYIFTELDGMEDLFFDLLVATADGELCHNEFGYTGPGPAGSINAAVTRNLHIPTITVETFRGFDIYRRVYDQLDTVRFVLEFYEMR